MTNPFSWDYLTAPISDMATFGPFSTAFVIIFGVVFLVSAFVATTIEKRFPGDAILRHAVNRLCQALMWTTGIGLFFFSFRLMRVEFLTLYMRFWSYLFFLVFLGMIGYFIYWYQTSYQVQRQEVERQRERRKYMPRNTAPRRRPKLRGKRGIR